MDAQDLLLVTAVVTALFTVLLCVEAAIRDCLMRPPVVGPSPPSVVERHVTNLNVQEG